MSRTPRAGLRRWLRYGAAGVAGIWLLSTMVWTVQQDETGVVLRFGGVARSVGPGIHLSLPWPVERMDKLKTSMSRTMPVGFTFIEELSGRPGSPVTREWLTGDTNIINIEVTLYYAIADAVSFRYGMSDMSDGMPREMAIRRAAESAMTEIIAGMGVDDLLGSGKAAVRLQVLEKTQALLDTMDLGVRLTNFNIRNIAPPPEVSPAFDNVINAKSYREQQVSEAEADRNSALPFARGEAERLVQEAASYQAAVLNQARGEAQSFRSLAASLTVHRQLGMRRLWIEAVERLLKGRRMMVVPAVPEGETSTVYLRD